MSERVSVPAEVAELLRADQTVIPIDSLDTVNVTTLDDYPSEHHIMRSDSVWVALIQPCPTCNGRGEVDGPRGSIFPCAACSLIADHEVTEHNAFVNGDGRLWFTITTPCPRCINGDGVDHGLYFGPNRPCGRCQGVGAVSVVEASIQHIIPVYGTQEGVGYPDNGPGNSWIIGNNWFHREGKGLYCTRVDGEFVAGGFAVVLNTRPSDV